MTGLRGILEFVKLSPRQLIILSVIGIAVLFIPEDLARGLGLNNLPRPIRTTIGILTLFSTLSLIVHIADYFIKAIQKRRRTHANQQVVLARLSSLSDNEYRIMSHCITMNQQTVTIHLLNEANSAALALCSKGLLQQSIGGNRASMIVTHEPSYTIPDFVWLSPELYALKQEQD